MLVAQLLVNGLALGAAYALVALGFVLILNATSAVNFAQGDMVMAGGFVAVALAALAPAGTLPGALLLPGVMILMAALGLLFSLIAYFPLRRRPPVAVFISTIAVGVVLQSGANGLFGGAPRAAPALIGSGNLQIVGLTVSRQSLAILVVAAVLVLLVQFVLDHTQFGRRLRATAQDAEMARAVGVPVPVMIGASFAIAAALAGAAGLLLANQFFVTPTSGINLMIKAYIAVTIGGWGNVKGAVAGALLIALFEVFVGTLISTTIAEAALYVLLLAILFVRPQGLFGEAAERRA